MTTPFDTPSAYDFFTLDGEESPLCYINSGGHRVQQVQKQQAPGFGGAFTVFRIEEISDVEYEFPAWNAAQYLVVKAFAARLVAGSRQRPVKAYKFLDLRLEHIGIKLVSPFDISPLDKSKGSQMRRLLVKFVESKKLQPFGGVPSANPANEFQQKMAKLERENADKLALAKARRASSHAGRNGG